jgi:hypothetical protein
MGKRRARPGLYQCSSGDCRFQFTVTTHTPLHATKLPLCTWLKAMWLLLQSDKGLSSVRLAETLGVSQPTAWRIGHALRLMVARENMLDGTVEVVASVPRCHGSPDAQKSGRRHHHQIGHSCLWLIKASYDFELLLFRPQIGGRLLRRPKRDDPAPTVDLFCTAALM